MIKLFKNSFTIFLTTFISVFLICCTGKEPNVSLANSTNSQSQQIDFSDTTVCVILIDGSKSYKYLENAKKTIATLVYNSKLSMKIYVRWITDNSILDKYAIVTALLPTEPKPLKNPFANPQVKNNHKKLIKRIEAIRKKIIDQIMNAKSPNSSRTDIWGGIYAASERFKINPKMKPMLIILSDLIDNVGNSYSTLDLKNATVKILDFQADKNIELTKQEWANRLKSLGAKTVEFYYPDEILTFSSEN